VRWSGDIWGKALSSTRLFLSETRKLLAWENDINTYVENIFGNELDLLSSFGYCWRKKSRENSWLKLCYQYVGGSAIYRIYSDLKKD
jgi:hypothetical protein